LEQPVRSSHLAFVLVAFGGGVSATLACSAIIGLDSFDKVDCDACLSDAGDSGITSDSNAPPPDAQLGDVASNPAVWASWPMPNPVFDAGFPPDADLSGLHFVQYASVSGAVQEGLTLLVWSLSTAPQRSQQDAVTYCDGLKDQTWRLPSRIELVTLIDFTRSGPPYIDPVFDGGGIVNAQYWTSSVDRTNLNNYWTVDFGKGSVTVDDSAQSHDVICVTGGKARQ
jgi:hypothetical protein